MWDLVPLPGLEPGPPALGVRSLNHWTTRKALGNSLSCHQNIIIYANMMTFLYFAPVYRSPYFFVYSCLRTFALTVPSTGMLLLLFLLLLEVSGLLQHISFSGRLFYLFTTL